MKILFIIPYPVAKSPSQRFRFEQYFNTLTENGWKYDTHSFLDDHGWAILYRPGKLASKLWILIKGLIRRFFLLFRIPVYRFIFIHREAAPFGPPVLEWLIAKIYRKKIIYDFDDSIWLTDRENESALLRIVRWRSKVAALCKWSYKVSCGNQYLADYAKKFNHRVVINPTTIDTENLHNPNLYPIQSKDHITIGWTGSHSTLKYLHSIETVIQNLQVLHPDLNFLVIANQKPNLNLTRVEFVKWNKETEAQDLLRIDIGVMPLPDDEWSKGKCGFKALQYMAMKIPCVVSPVGVNTEIVDHRENGYLAQTDEEWTAYLEALIKDVNLRKEAGEAGRKKVIQKYSVLSNSSTFLFLFE